MKIKEVEFYHHWTKNPIMGWAFTLFCVGYNMEIFGDYGRDVLDSPVYEIWVMFFNFGFNIRWELKK